MTAPLVPVGVVDARARLVSDADYLPVILDLVDRARATCLCSVFIVDLAPSRDRVLSVGEVLRALAAARWRGVDVRLLVGGSRENLEIAETADVARARALALGIPCRWATSKPGRGSHAKFVVADDAVLTGSHNWSPGAFGGQVQDSLLLRSVDLAAYVASIFERQWATA